jgi:hypothetical protein
MALNNLWVRIGRYLDLIDDSKNYTYNAILFRLRKGVFCLDVREARHVDGLVDG